MAYLGNITLEDTVGTAAIKDDAVTADKLANTINTDIATGVTAGTTASAALPKAGGAMTGAITTNSTFDGRDVATDGTKLDGIEASATADQSNAEIKTAYEANSDTNAFTDADHSKLDGIAAGATAYTHPTSAGNKHIPSGGSADQVLTYDSSGTAVWADAGGGGVEYLQKWIFNNTNDTMAIPTGASKVRVFAAAGGGGGGGAGYAGDGGHGGSGATAIGVILDVSGGTTYNISVGAGGSGGNSSWNGGNSGGTGGTTTFGNLITLGGGVGGNNANKNVNGNAGAGGTGSGGSGGTHVAGTSGGNGSHFFNYNELGGGTGGANNYQTPAGAGNNGYIVVEVVG